MPSPENILFITYDHNQGNFGDIKPYSGAIAELGQRMTGELLERYRPDDYSPIAMEQMEAVVIGLQGQLVISMASMSVVNDHTSELNNAYVVEGSRGQGIWVTMFEKRMAIATLHGVSEVETWVNPHGPLYFPLIRRGFVYRRSGLRNIMLSKVLIDS